MNVYAISDLHLSFDNEKPMSIFGDVWEDHFEEIKKDWNSRVKDEDVVLVPGDFSWAMSLDGVKPDMEIFNELKGFKIIVRGNHDYWWSSYSKVKAVLPNNVFAIQNNAIRIGNVVFCGTKGYTVEEKGKPYTEEDKKLFDREYIRLGLSLDVAQNIKQEGDKLIVLFHYPPFNNKTEDSEYTKKVEEVGADAVVFGHLHGKHPIYRLKIIKNNIPYYLTSCDVVKNKLVQII